MRHDNDFIHIVRISYTTFIQIVHITCLLRMRHITCLHLNASLFAFTKFADILSMALWPYPNGLLEQLQHIYLLHFEWPTRAVTLHF